MLTSRSITGWMSNTSSPSQEAGLQSGGTQVRICFAGFVAQEPFYSWIHCETDLRMQESARTFFYLDCKILIAISVLIAYCVNKRLFDLILPDHASCP